MRETRLVSALEQPLPGKGLAPPPGEQGSHPSDHCGLKSRPLPAPRRAGLRPVRATAVPYAGDGRSAGGRCRSRARGGTESSRLGPEVRTPSAPPLCREQSSRMSSESRDAPPPPRPARDSHLRPGLPPPSAGPRESPRLQNGLRRSRKSSQSLSKTPLPLA